MDETRVVPKRSHFCHPWTHDGVRANIMWRHRCTVAPVNYFYIDFGLSIWCSEGQEDTAAIGVFGQIKEVPELSDTVPYNPFKVDIYHLGYTILDIIKVNSPIAVIRCTC